MKQIKIGFLIYDGVVELDVMGAYQVFAFSPQIEIYLIGISLSTITTNEGLILTPDKDINHCPSLDVICVPGGGIKQIEIMDNQKIREFLKKQAITAKYITSVCTGSIILASAGLLQGYKATCHWAFKNHLSMLGVEVISQRVVKDGNRITCAGVTSGIDLALMILALVCTEDEAKMAELMMEYDPKPPFNTGIPEKAGTKIVTTLLDLGSSLLSQFSSWAKGQQT